MCRMAGWTGAPRPLSSLLYDPERSLSTQAWDPREMLYGNVNVDGTGVAWWPVDQPGEPPLRYATPAAAWNDANLPALADRLHGTQIIAAVRSATPGIPFGPTNVAPFVRGDVALSHNGFVQDFRTGVGRRLLAQVSDEAFGEMDAVSDSQTILLLVRTHLAEGNDLAEAVGLALDQVRHAVEAHGVGATLNLLVGDGDVLLATKASYGLGHNSLYVASEPDGVCIASEPLDAARTWEAVEPQSLVTVRGGEVAISRLTA